MKSIFFTLILTLMLAACSTGQQKIGYVNSVKIFQESPIAQEAMQRIDAIRQPMQDSLTQMQQQLAAKVDAHHKKAAKMSTITKNAEWSKLVDMDQIIGDYYTQKLGNGNSVLTRETEKILAPIRIQVRAAIDEIAKEEKYDFVFDKTENILVVLYANEAHDLTFKVLEKLQQKK